MVAGEKNLAPDMASSTARRDKMLSDSEETNVYAASPEPKVIEVDRAAERKLVRKLDAWIVPPVCRVSRDEMLFATKTTQWIANTISY